MFVVHLAPYAPNRAGIYEAARDMVRADAERGHTTIFVDVGPTHPDGTQEDARVGEIDDRGGFQLVTMDPAYINDADLLVFHTGVDDNWVVKSQAPIIVVIHSRPLAAFRPEQANVRYVGYSLVADFARWPRVKKLIYFWPEFTPYWRIMAPLDKLVALDWPPIDLARFSPEGERYQFPPEMTGEWNALICDSWREDIDCYEVAHGALEAAKLVPGLRTHFFAMDTREDGALANCWNLVTDGLRQWGGLGSLNGRVAEFAPVLRAADFVMTPNRIVTRVVGEALACGVPVLAEHGCKVTPWTAHMHDPEEVARVAADLIAALKKDRQKVKRQCLKTAQQFSLANYGKRVEPVYQDAVSGTGWWMKR